MAGPSEDIDPQVAGRIRLVILDVDGVLTDGGVYVGARPGQDAIELKRFDIQDGLGVKMLGWAGIEVAIVSGRVSEATAWRAEELGVDGCGKLDPLPRLVVVLLDGEVVYAAGIFDILIAVLDRDPGRIVEPHTLDRHPRPIDECEVGDRLPHLHA